MSKQLDYARQQIIGFSHAVKGYNIESLAASMGLTKAEWEQVKDDPALTPEMVKDLNKHFSKA